MSRPGEYVRRHYGVPARIGRPIVTTWPPGTERPGRITGFDGQYLIVKFDDARRGRERLHPTWEIRYPLDHDGDPLESDG